MAFDVSEEWASVARRYWVEAGVEGKIELRMKDAVSGLEELLREGESETYDFAFIDADKKEYGEYFERVLRLIRRGGLIMGRQCFMGRAGFECRLSRRGYYRHSGLQ